MWKSPPYNDTILFSSSSLANLRSLRKILSRPFWAPCVL